MSTQQRTRNYRGQFTPQGPRTSKKLKRLEKKHENAKELGKIRDTMFEEFLHVFFRKGKNTDKLPSARSNGPLVDIFERVMKPPFRLPRNKRSIRLLDFYKDAGHLRIQNKISPEDRAAAAKCSGLSGRRPDHYRGCRLPCISKRATEMAEVKRWLGTVAARGGLVTASVEDAYNICEQMIERYDPSNCGILTTREHAPQQQSAQGSLCSNCSTLINPTDSNCEVRGPPTGTAQSRQESLPVVSAGDARAETIIASNGRYDEQTSTASQEDIARKNRFDAVMKMAKNHNTFLMISMLFEEGLEHDFGTFAGPFLEYCKRNKTAPTKLMREVLLYAYWRTLGIPNEEEHDVREEKLKATLRILKAARVAAGEKTYEEMQWNFR